MGGNITIVSDDGRTKVWGQTFPTDAYYITRRRVTTFKRTHDFLQLVVEVKKGAGIHDELDSWFFDHWSLFQAQGLVIELLNYYYSKYEHDKIANAALDIYTNRYIEHPARFILKTDRLVAPDYEVSVRSGYQGDFLLLTYTLPKKKKLDLGDTVPHKIVINLSAIFMFESLDMSVMTD